MVTHLTTNPPVKGLTCGERTGSSVFLCLWSYVKDVLPRFYYIDVVTAQMLTTNRIVANVSRTSEYVHMELPPKYRILSPKCLRIGRKKKGIPSKALQAPVSKSVYVRRKVAKSKVDKTSAMKNRDPKMQHTCNNIHQHLHLHLHLPHTSHPFSGVFGPLSSSTNSPSFSPGLPKSSTSSTSSSSSSSSSSVIPIISPLRRPCTL